LENTSRLDPADGEGTSVAGLGFEEFSNEIAVDGSSSPRSPTEEQAGPARKLLVAQLSDALCVYDGAGRGSLALYSLRTSHRLSEVVGPHSRPVLALSFGHACVARLATDELVFLQWEGWRSSLQLLRCGPSQASPEAPPEVTAMLEAIKASRASRAEPGRQTGSPSLISYEDITVPRWQAPFPLQPLLEKVEPLAGGRPRLAYSPEELLDTLLQGYKRNNGGAISLALKRISAALPAFNREQLEVLSLLLKVYPRPSLHTLPPSLLAGLGAEGGARSAGPSSGLARRLQETGVQQVPVSERPYDQLVLSL